MASGSESDPISEITILERALMMSLKGLIREPGFSGFSAKAEGKGDCSPLAEARGNMENRDKMMHLK
jgi:hypothetical protein